MSRHGMVLLVCLFVLIGSFLSGVQLYAQTSQATNGTQGRFEISIGGGWGLYNMTNINKHYIDEFAKEFDIFDDHIDNGPSIFGEVGYFVSPNVSANVGVMYLHGEVEKQSDESVMDEFGNPLSSRVWKRSLKATLVAPELRIKYYFTIKKADLFFGGGIAWCFGRSSLKSSESGAGEEQQHPSYSNVYKFSAEGLGFLASTGASYNLNKTLSVGAEVGYRRFATGDLKDKDGNIWEVQYLPTYYKMNLDFSGPFILGRLSLRL